MLSQEGLANRDAIEVAGGKKRKASEASPNSSKAKLKRKKQEMILITTRVVGERRIRGEVVAKAAVDCIRVRMPE